MKREIQRETGSYIFCNWALVSRTDCAIGDILYDRTVGAISRLTSQIAADVLPVDQKRASGKHRRQTVSVIVNYVASSRSLINKQVQCSTGRVASIEQRDRVLNFPVFAVLLHVPRNGVNLRPRQLSECQRRE